MRESAVEPIIPDKALDEDIAILGRKGRGKTYTARGLVERLLTLQRRVIVLDPLSTWWGLRTTADGKSAAFPIAVFGGPHGDLPIDDRVGRPLARVLAETHLSAILDMGEMHRAAQNRLVGDFLDELRAANRRPLTIVLEEADMFAPQQPMGDDSARVLGAVDWIARRGRSRGFKLISITQRPAKLNKDVLTQLSMLIALGLPSPHDRKAVEAWIEGNADRDEAKAVTASLAHLGVGEGWVWAPDFGLLKRVKFPQIATLDTSATPKVGAEPIIAQTLADVDLSAVRAVLAQKKGEQPEHGKAVGAQAIQEAEQRGFQRGVAEGERRGRAGLARELAHAIHGAREAIEQALGRIEVPADPPAPVEPAHVPVAKLARNERRHDTTPAARSRALAGMSPTARKILAVLEATHPLSLPFKAAALRAGASPRSSAFSGYRTELLNSGRVIEEGGRMKAIEGDGAVSVMADPIELFRSKLRPSIGKMLQVVAQARSALTREEVADLAGVSRTSSGLNAGLHELVALELIVKDANGAYCLAPELQDR